MIYADLLSKSNFSFLEGASHPGELIETAHARGYYALGLVDRNGFYGMVRAYDRAKDLKFKAVYGVEVQIEGASLALLARNFLGYQSICRLLTAGFFSGESEGLPPQKGKPKLTRATLETYLKASDIHLLLPPRDFPSLGFFHWLRERFPITQLVTKKLHADIDARMKSWLKSLPADIPRAWTWDAHFHQADRHELFEVLQAIRSNQSLSKHPPSTFNEAYLKPLNSLQAYRVPEAWIHRGVQIADECGFCPSEIRYHYPREWLPEGKTPHLFLRELCEKGLQTRYPNGAPAAVLKQMEHEIRLVAELEYEDYFLTVWDLVQFARTQKILCQGRGSAANSVICYLLEITSIDPVQMNLLFERFISKERNEAPDIDVDFEHERREEVIQYVYQKYGRHRSGMVATLITYRTRSALRDVGRILEVDSSQLEDWSHRARWREQVLEDQPTSLKLQRVLRLAKQLKGFPRHLGQHTGGMILCQNRLDEISPIEPASMLGRSVVQWDKYDIEKLGLLKIDLLSLGMLTCLRKSFDLLKQKTGNLLELHQIPHGDPKTYEMIGRSLTVGVFQIESRAQMSMLPRLRPKNFYDLVIEVAIVRPGPIQGGMVHPYLRRRMGLEPVTYAHPKLKPILEKTLGIPIFQEQVMKIAIEVAGYSPGEADALRRAMGAWKKRGNLDHYARDICERLIAQKIPAEFAKRICDQILGFGEYGFPESHAASFALLTYASAYLKANHPEVFFCALLNSMPLGFYSVHALTANFIREGGKILSPSLQHSQWDHQLEKISETTWAIRLGFRIVKGLQKEHVDKFLNRRDQTGEKDLYIFDQDERAAFAMVEEAHQKRLSYWAALAPASDPLSLQKQARSPAFKAPNPLENMLLDFEFTSTTLPQHPTQLLRERYWRYSIPVERIQLARQLEDQRPHQQVAVFGMIQVVQSPPTAKGMYFLTLEDESGFLNLVLTPQIYEKFKGLVQGDWSLLAVGRLQKTQKYSSILVSQIIAPRIPQAIVQKLEEKKAAVQTLCLGAVPKYGL